jgi:hypothetical protein
LSRTDGVVLTAPPSLSTGYLTLPDRRVLYCLIEGVFYFVQFVFRLRVFVSFGVNGQA